MDAAVSRAASIWLGCNGLALIATRRRLVSDGNCDKGCLSLAAASPAQIAAITDQQSADRGECRELAVVDFDPAKQRHRSDEAGGDQEDSRGREQPGRDGISGDGAAGLVGPVPQI